MVRTVLVAVALLALSAVPGCRSWFYGTSYAEEATHGSRSAAVAPAVALDPTAIVRLEGLGGYHGSGVAIGTRTILTAAHVVDPAAPPIVWSLTSPPQQTAVVLFVPGQDLALLEVREPMAAYAPIDCRRPSWGEDVWAGGFPLLSYWAILRGYVASPIPPALQPGDMTAYGGHIPDFVILDLSTNHGLSGGPVFDSDGEVVGIVSGALADTTPMGDSYMSSLALIVPGDVICAILS